MEIIMTGYHSGSPQDLKYLFFKKGYHIVQVEQLGKCKLRIIFEKEFGNIMCYDLIECDLKTSDGQKRYKDLNLFDEKCKKFVGRTIEMLQTI